MNEDTKNLLKECTAGCQMALGSLDQIKHDITDHKLMAEKDSHQIAKLMMDGCNMGIQSVSEYQNQYRNASKEALELAQKLVRAEEDFMEEMKQFL
ncbi:MAG TPA: hypothetical protein PLZ77_02655 [Lachnospiraceae bacterium]|nr:hypothetical protein [Lachnospiraceae bacterium]